MFSGYGSLTLESDHLDLSYRDPDAWPNMTPAGSIKSFMFDIGDPVAGPVVQLGLIAPHGDEHLDWEHSVDPAHFHGSDQFRVCVGGEWALAGRPMPAGAYAFQESGRVYREHPGDDGAAWIALVIGDRRGAKPTIIHEADRANLIETGQENYEPVDEGQAYPHPAGPGGVAAITTTAGACQRGYLRGTLADLAAQTPRNQGSVVTGLFGEEHSGPVAHVLKYGAGQVVAPWSVYATERLLIVTGGSCRIGEADYWPGDMRIQQADAPMEAIISGPAGLEAAIVVADRRARPVLADRAETAAPSWMFEADSVRHALAPAPGGR